MFYVLERLRYSDCLVCQYVHSWGTKQAVSFRKHVSLAGTALV